MHIALAEVFDDDLKAIWLVMEDFWYPDAEAAEKIADGGIAGVFAAFWIVGTPDPGLFRFFQSAEQASAALFWQGFELIFFRFEIKAFQDSRIRFAFWKDGFWGEDILASEDAVGVEQGAWQAAIVPEYGIMQVGAGGDTQFDTQAECASALDSFQFEFKATSGLFCLGFPQQRVGCQSAVSNFSMSSDIIRWGADILPEDLGFNTERLYQPAKFNGLLIGCDDIRGVLILRQ